MKLVMNKEVNQANMMALKKEYNFTSSPMAMLTSKVGEEFLKPKIVKGGRTIHSSSTFNVFLPTLSMRRR